MHWIILSRVSLTRIFAVPETSAEGWEFPVHYAIFRLIKLFGAWDEISSFLLMINRKWKQVYHSSKWHVRFLQHLSESYKFDLETWLRRRKSVICAILSHQRFCIVKWREIRECTSPFREEVQPFCSCGYTCGVVRLESRSPGPY